MKTFAFGDIVLLKIPYSDGQTYKKRPALVLLDTQDEDMIVCRITSKIYSTAFDIEIDDWQNCSLKLPSVIRTHKIATLEKELVVMKMGEINNQIKERVKDTLQRLIHF